MQQRKNSGSRKMEMKTASEEAREGISKIHQRALQILSDRRATQAIKKAAVLQNWAWRCAADVPDEEFDQFLQTQGY